MKSHVIFILAPLFLFPFLLNAQSLIGSNIIAEASGDNFGKSVSISSDGNRVAIGAPQNDGINGSNSGHVRVYQYNGSSWDLLGDDIDGEAADDNSGWSVSLSSNGNRVAIGATQNDGNGSNSGHVRVYEYNGSSWDLLGSDIDGDAANDKSGWSVSLSSDGNRVAIGTPNHGSSSGQVRVFEYNGSAWGKLGSDINGEAAYDQSATVISLSPDGNRVAVGAGLNSNSNGTYSGHVRVFEYIGSSWDLLGDDIDGEAANDYSGEYGLSLSANGNIVAIGAMGNDGNGSSSGHVRVYEYNGSSWGQLGGDIDGEAANDYSGASVSLSSNGTIVAIGSTNNDDNGAGSGQVRIYQYNGSSWDLLGNDINGESTYESLGNSISISPDGSSLAIGAVGYNSSGAAKVLDLSALLSTEDFLYSQVNLYPNPTSDEFTIQFHKGIELQKVNIFNNFGQFIYSTQGRIIKTSELSTGIYYAEIVTNKGKISKKIVVK